MTKGCKKIHFWHSAQLWASICQVNEWSTITVTFSSYLTATSLVQYLSKLVRKINMQIINKCMCEKAKTKKLWSTMNSRDNHQCAKRWTNMQHILSQRILYWGDCKQGPLNWTHSISNARKRRIDRGKSRDQYPQCISNLATLEAFLVGRPSIFSTFLLWKIWKPRNKSANEVALITTRTGSDIVLL